jgi:hypothetical protein
MNCIHGRRKDYCKECHGKQICEHNRRREICKDCCGSQICEHNKNRGYCKECHGSQLCEHSRRRDQCRVCDPIKWATSVLALNKHLAKKSGYIEPKITPDELLKLPKSVCYLCRSSLVGHRIHLHHNHLTGKVYGYVHSNCNRVEGLLGRLSLDELKIFMKNIEESRASTQRVGKRT